jgi:hypothetical protein
MSALNRVMSRGFVSPQVHGVLDYPLAAIRDVLVTLALIVLPFAVGFSYRTPAPVPFAHPMAFPEAA